MDTVPNTDPTPYEKIFDPVQHYRSGSNNWAVVVIDMNQDGNVDVVSASRSDGLISVHYNDGTGDFKEKKRQRIQDSHRAMVTLDANNDGWPDIATVTERGKVCVLFNDQQGFLKTSQVIYSGVMGQDILCSDMDKDGDLDLITVTHANKSVNIHINNGQGKFASALSLETGAKPRCLDIADINGDGLPDIVVGGDLGNLYIHMGAGPMQFRNHTKLISCRDIWGVGLADFDKDGDIDIATCSYLNQDLFIHLNKGNGEFNIPQQLESGAHNINLVIVDLDRDDDLDIVTTSNADNAINFHINKGKGIFEDRRHRSTGQRPVSIGKGDFDGDGDVDVVTGSTDDASINVHKNMYIENSVLLRKRNFLVKGKVFDKDIDKTLPHVSVSLRSSADKGLDATFTDENGYFEFEMEFNQLNKDYFLLARTKGFPPGRVSFTMPEGHHEEDIYLEVPKETSVQVKVVDARSGDPIEGAELSLLDPDENLLKNSRADANGEYAYRKISLGYGYEVLASADGYDSQSEFFDVEKDDIGKGIRVIVRMSKEPIGRCVTGVVTDRFTGEIVPRAGLIFKDSTGRTRAKVRATEEGMYRKCLPYGEYELTTIAKGYFYEVSGFDLENNGSRDEFEYDVTLKPLAKDSAILLNVYFDKAKYDLKSEYFPELRRALKIMQQNPSIIMEIAGHTSSEGGYEYNRRLSQNRASAVVDYLVENGIDRNRLLAKGYGESQLVIEPDDTSEKREKNRRTEFKVVKTEE